MLVEQIRTDLANGLIDEAIAKQRHLPPPLTQEQAAVYARLRAKIAERLTLQGHSAGVFDILQPYDTAPSRARLPVQERALVSLHLGEAYSSTLNYPSALTLLDEAIRYSSIAGEKELESVAHLELGQVYYHLGEYVIAREHLNIALKSFVKSSNKALEARCYLYFGLVSSGLGNFDEGLSFLNQAITLSKEAKDEKVEAEATVNLGTTHFFQGKLRKAILIYENLLKTFESSLASSVIAQTYNNLAYSLILCGDLIRAEQLLEKSITISRRIQYDQGEAIALGLFGLLYGLRDQIQTARQMLDSSLELARQINFKECISFANIELGAIYISLNDTKQAINHLQEGLKIAQQINRIFFAVEAKLLLANAYTLEKNFDQAGELLANAEILLSRSPNLLLEGRWLYTKGNISVARGEGETISFTRAIAIFETLSLPLEKAFCFIKRAELLSRKKSELIKAVSDTERAIEILDELGAKHLVTPLQEKFKEMSRRLPKVTGGQASFKQQLLQDRKSISKMIKSCKDRESLISQIADAICLQLNAEIVVLYEADTEAKIKFLTATDDVSLFKKAIDRRVQDAVKLGQKGWIAGRKYDELLYLATIAINEQKQLLVVAWTTSKKFVHEEMVQNFVEIAGELFSISVQQEGRRVEFSEADSKQLKNFANFKDLVYASRKMSELSSQILRIHSSDLTVLITGESGTGKELVARAIHSVSERSGRPFIPFNCTATPSEIVEAQLFGYRKGAFTGANVDYEGIIRAANGGTLLLDEIGDLHLSIQPKLLRFFQEGEIQPIGYSRPIRVDVRVLASTNRDLEVMVERGEFREDLYHRLNIIRLYVPSLRQRREEIILLAQFFLQQACQRTGKELGFSAEVLSIFEGYDWPGNVRQLKNEIDRIVAFSGDKGIVEKYDLSSDIVQSSNSLKLTDTVAATELNVNLPLTPGTTLEDLLALTEKEIITKTIKQCKGNIRRTALLLGVSRKGLYDKMKRLKIRY